jgi:hypothetical protein
MIKGTGIMKKDYVAGCELPRIPRPHHNNMQIVVYTILFYYFFLFPFERGNYHVMYE